jgi:hypothetical protein
MTARKTKIPNLSSSELAEQLKRETLVGVTAASKLLDIKPPNFKRDAVPRLTRIPVAGSADVYFRSEVEALAVELNAAREARNGHETPAPAPRPTAARARRQPGPDVTNIRSSKQSRGHVKPIPKAGARG